MALPVLDVIFRRSFLMSSHGRSSIFHLCVSLRVKKKYLSLRLQQASPTTPWLEPVFSKGHGTWMMTMEGVAFTRESCSRLHFPSFTTVSSISHLFLAALSVMWDLVLTRIEPSPLHWEPVVLTTGSPGKPTYSSYSVALMPFPLSANICVLFPWIWVCLRLWQSETIWLLRWDLPRFPQLINKGRTGIWCQDCLMSLTLEVSTDTFTLRGWTASKHPRQNKLWTVSSILWRVFC